MKEGGEGVREIREKREEGEEREQAGEEEGRNTSSTPTQLVYMYVQCTMHYHQACSAM